MIERRPFLDVVSHLVLILGALIIAFPLYIAFVASTQSAEQASAAPLSLVPGSHFIDNYSALLLRGTSSNVSTAPVARMLWVITKPIN